MQLTITIIVSLLGGGLSGACINVAFNRYTRQRQLRTAFYQVLLNMYSAYVIRMENPTGRYWINIVGNNPSSDDKEFVEHRSSFVSELVQYNELKEVRTLRTVLLDNGSSGNHTRGEEFKLDLLPESNALGACLAKVHKDLGL